MCHGDIVDRISGINDYANICNNGKKEMMKIPSGFKSPREKYQVCKWEVKLIKEYEHTVSKYSTG